jgi:type III secretory pathway component EscR
MKVGNIKVLDYLFVNWGDVLFVKGIDEVTQSRHLYVWAPVNQGISDLHSEEERVQNTIQWWQKFKDDKIEGFLNRFIQRPNDIRISDTTEGK